MNVSSTIRDAAVAGAATVAAAAATVAAPAIVPSVCVRALCTIVVWLGSSPPLLCVLRLCMCTLYGYALVIRACMCECVLVEPLLWHSVHSS